MSELAMQVYQSATEHVDIHWNRWRHVQVPLAQESSLDLQPTLRQLDSLDRYLVDQARRTAQPKEHTFSIKAVR